MSNPLSSRTTRFYLITGLPGEDYEFAGWSRTEEAAEGRRLKAVRAHKDCKVILAADRDQAARRAQDIHGVRVRGYLDPADRKIGQHTVRSAVVRAIFCPFTGAVLDMRRAVVIGTGTQSFVMAASHWDEIKDEFFSRIGDAAGRVTVLDGRELFR